MAENNARMTEGNEVKQILLFMLPLLLSNIFQQVYTMVDSMVVGRFVSSVALGSVGTVGNINFMFLSLCIGLSGGVNVLIAHFYGAEDIRGVKRIIGNSVYVTLISGLLMSLISIVLARPILTLMRVPEANFADALSYMRIVCGATVIVAIYNTSSQILRALGDSKTPLYCVILSSIMNVILDVVFTLGMGWGVVGVAWATVLAQAAAAAGSLLIPLRKNEMFQLCREDFRYSPDLARKICSMGIPLAMQNAMGAINGMITQSIVNSFGSVIMSAYTACGRVEQILAQPYGTLGVAIANFTGQNVGAGKYNRVQSACRKSVIMVEGYAVMILGLSLVCSRQMIGIFMTDPEMIRIGSGGLKIIAVSYFFTGLIYIYKAMLNGAGDTAFAMGNGIIEIIARLLFLFVLVSIPMLGYWGIWLTSIPSAIVAVGLCLARYRAGHWKHRVLNETE